MTQNNSSISELNAFYFHNYFYFYMLYIQAFKKLRLHIFRKLKAEKENFKKIEGTLLHSIPLLFYSADTQLFCYTNKPDLHLSDIFKRTAGLKRLSDI